MLSVHEEDKPVSAKKKKKKVHLIDHIVVCINQHLHVNEHSILTFSSGQNLGIIMYSKHDIVPYKCSY